MGNSRRIYPEVRKPQSLQEQFEAGYDSDDLEDQEPIDYKKEAKAAFGRISVHLSFTKNDAVQRPVAFCTAMMSCVVVVVAVSLMVSALDNLPMVFLRLAESDNGEIDVTVQAGTDASSAVSLNYSKIAGKFIGSAQSYHSPRIDFGTSAAWKLENCLRGAGSESWVPSRGSDTELYPADVFNTTRLWYKQEGGRCVGSEVVPDFGCAGEWCNVTQRDVRVWGMDTVREKYAGIGRQWPYQKLRPGEVVIDNRFANAIQVIPGDYAIVRIPAAPNLLQAFIDVNFTTPFKPYYTAYPVVHAVVKVVAVTDDPFGKLASSDTNWLIMEYESIMRLFETYLHPAMPAEKRRDFGLLNPYQFAKTISFNMPPRDRVDAYNSQEFSTVLRRLTKFATPIVERIGFNQIGVELKILGWMFSSRFFSLFLGLILSLIIAILSVLAVVLIYSLMSVGIQTKTFEFAVLRMVGMQRRDLALLIVVQALCFAIPAWAIGLALGQAAFVAISRVLQSSLGVEIDPKLTPDAIGIATALGFTLPVIAGIFPMLEVMKHQLTSSLDGSRSKVKAVTFTVRRSTNSTVQWPLVILGIAMTIFGFCIYYLFPIALLNFDIQLMFYIFFGILMAMLFGLLLLALNLERPLEIFLTYLFFFWESAAVRSLILKNLIAHRLRNRKTTMMYSLSLGFIIFITVAFNIQVKTVEFQTLQRLGGTVQLDGDFGFDALVAAEESLTKLAGPGALVADWGIASNEIGRVRSPGEGRVKTGVIETMGRYKSTATRLTSVSPGYFDVTDNRFLRMNNGPTGDYAVAIVEQLYTAHYSHMAYIGASIEKVFNVKTSRSRFAVTMTTVQNRTTGATRTHRFVKQALMTFDKAPGLAFSSFPSRLEQDTIVSFPALIALGDGQLKSVEELPFGEIVLALTQEDEMTIDIFAIWFEYYMNLAGFGGAVGIEDVFNDTGSLQTASSVLNTFFLFTAVIAMVICFFSLMSSMRANIFEQKKEIGILLSLGMRRFALARLYVWEGFILVLAAALMGICIGTMVAFTMNLQRALFVELPIPFEFPTAITVMVIIMSMVFGFLASIGPMMSLLSERAVSSIIRSM